MFNLTITTPISLFISLSALTGVALHDTKIDKLATAFIGIPAMVTHAEAGAKAMSGDAHTHVERVSLSEMRTTQPKLAPRSEVKKHMLQRNAPKGAHRYDGYTLALA